MITSHEMSSFIIENNSQPFYNYIHDVSVSVVATFVCVCVGWGWGGGPD